MHGVIDSAACPSLPSKAFAIPLTRFQRIRRILGGPQCGLVFVENSELLAGSMPVDLSDLYGLY